MKSLILQHNWRIRLFIREFSICCFGVLAFTGIQWFVDLHIVTAINFWLECVKLFL